MANDEIKFLVPEHAEQPSGSEISELEVEDKGLADEGSKEDAKLDKEAELSVSEAEHGVRASEADPNSKKKILNTLISTKSEIAGEKGQILEKGGVTKAEQALNELGLKEGNLNPEDLVPLNLDAADLSAAVYERPEEDKAA